MKQEKKIQQTGKRQLKVYRKYFPRSYHRFVVFPEIRLSGKWLQEMGFNFGKSVIVKHKKNKITITLNNKITNKNYR